jgi:hypothetical protein
MSNSTAHSRLLLRAALALGIALLMLTLFLSFTLRMNSHYRFSVTAPIGLVGAALARWAKRNLASQSDQ